MQLKKRVLKERLRKRVIIFNFQRKGTVLDQEGKLREIIIGVEAEAEVGKKKDLHQDIRNHIENKY